MDIKVSPKKTANVIIGEDSYKVRVPTVLEAEKYTSDVKDDGSSKSVILMLDMLGLPTAVSESLDVMQLSEILEGITSLAKKK